jgi:hypothetical protein
MKMRYIILSAVSAAWLFVALVISVAAISLVAESGFSEMPVLAWLAVAIVFGVALPALLFGGYRWVFAGREA